MPARTRAIALLLTALAALLVGQYVRHWLTIPADLAKTSDFAGSYIAASFWRAGHANLVYDDGAQHAALLASGAAADEHRIPFEDPPQALWAAVPATALSPADAYRAWSLLQLALALAAITVAVLTAPWRRGISPLMKVCVGAVAAAGLPIALLFIEAQWDGFAMVGLVLAYSCWQRERSALGGFALSLTSCLAKPHLMIGVAVFLVGRRDWRALSGAGLGALLMLLAGVAVVGPSGLAAYVQLVAQPANSPATQMQGITGLAASWFGAGSAVTAVTLVASAIAAVAAWRVGSISRAAPRLTEVSLATSAALSLLLAPHLLGHDLSLLAPLLILVVASLTALPDQPWARWSIGGTVGIWALLSLAASADLGNGSAAPPGRLVPWVLALLAAGGVWVLSRQLAGAQAPLTAPRPLPARA